MPKTMTLRIAMAVALVVPAFARAQQAATSSTSGDVTFSKDIAPIVQRSCQNCHRSDGVAPMSLVTYEEVRPWARAIKLRTGLGPKAGVMPPWYVEKNIGIQQFHNDPSLSAEEIAKIAKWADSGAPAGNPADMPPPREWGDGSKWAIGTPDLIIKTNEMLVKGDAPDWWGEIPSVPTGLTEDRYVSALEIKEVNDVDVHAKNGRATVGGRFVFHHMIWRTQVVTDESDRTQDPLAIFNDEAIRNRRACSRQVRASSRIQSTSTQTDAIPGRIWRLASNSSRWDISPLTNARSSGSAMAWTSTSRPWKPTSSSMRTRSCSSPRRSSRSNHICMRRVRGCASKPSGATTSRP